VLLVGQWAAPKADLSAASKAVPSAGLMAELKAER
jgi:hypothetical protein